LQTFKQSSLYYAHLNGGLLENYLNRNELHVCRVSAYGDPLLLATIVFIAKYALDCFYASRMPHLEGDEVFGSCKQGANLPPKSKGDLHKHDHVKFFRL
jgi:hypothetical protein